MSFILQELKLGSGFNKSSAPKKFLIMRNVLIKKNVINSNYLNYLPGISFNSFKNFFIGIKEYYKQMPG